MVVDRPVPVPYQVPVPGAAFVHLRHAVERPFSSVGSLLPLGMPPQRSLGTLSPFRAPLCPRCHLLQFGASPAASATACSMR